MLHSFFNNAQKEKFIILSHSLDQTNNNIDVLPHRIKAINDDLNSLNIPLIINTNLSYTILDTTKYHDPQLITYYKKEIRYQYTNFLLHQSTLFHLVRYIACNGPVAIDTLISELNISTSYIYKLVANFNSNQAEIMKIKLKIKNKEVDFDASLISIAVFIFSLSKYLPDDNLYPAEKLLEKPFDETDAFIAFFMPYMELIFDNTISGKELIVAILSRSTLERSNVDQLKLTGYKLIRQGGELIDLCYTLINYFRPTYPQILIDDFSLYVVELLKVLALIKTCPPELLFHNYENLLQQKYLKSIEQDLNNMRSLLPSVSNSIYTEEDLKELLLFIYPFLEQTKPQPPLKIFIELIDSILTSQLYRDTIASTLHKDLYTFVDTPREADLILTDNYHYIYNKSAHTFAYAIEDYIKEFEEKKFIKFILDIIEGKRHMSTEQLHYTASAINYSPNSFQK